MTADQLLEIEFPVMRYDITMPILEGRVAIDGVQLKPVKSSSMINREDPKMKAGEFGLCDLNIGYWLPAIEAGWEIVGLPVFSKRKPVYQLIFTHGDSEIRSPKDLEGKKVGSRTYRTALTVWARGLLQDRYGVDLSKIRWVVQAKEVFPVHDPAAKIEYVDDQKNMIERMIAREVDTHPKVKRLFPDYLGEDQKLDRDTGIYTPVHMIVMSRTLDRKRPDLAAKFYTAFERAKQVAYDDILSDRGGFSVVYLREKMKEQNAVWGDPWKYGLKANRSTIDAFIKYNLEQGMVRSQFFYGDLFAAGTLDT